MFCLGKFDSYAILFTQVIHENSKRSLYNDSIANRKDTLPWYLIGTYLRVGIKTSKLPFEVLEIFVSGVVKLLVLFRGYKAERQRLFSCIR
jgi:hypothetical protein